MYIIIIINSDGYGITYYTPPLSDGDGGETVSVRGSPSARGHDSTSGHDCPGTLDRNWLAIRVNGTQTPAAATPASRRGATASQFWNVRMLMEAIDHSWHGTKTGRAAGPGYCNRFTCFIFRHGNETGRNGGCLTPQVWEKRRGWGVGVRERETER